MDTAKGYIGLTDPDWYSFLSAHPRVDEVNFWRPHGGGAFRALKSGQLFFFKLRAPHRAIVGFGFFERFESLPAWLAWDCFGDMNGAPDFESMIDRIVRLRGDDGRSVRAGNFQIGCVMISAPVFFSQDEWVSPPDDWAKTGIQQGKTYQIDAGEGRRVLEECLSRVRTGDRYWNVDRTTRIVAEGSARYGSPISVRPRLGQLRRDLHRLYDRGYVTVTADYVFRVGDRLREEFRNGRSYYGLSGSTIAVPAHEPWQPSRELLAWHEQEVFEG